MEYRHCLADHPESLPVEKKYKDKKIKMQLQNQEKNNYYYNKYYC